jgi:E3 ubiquitin-protein ligase CHFR
MIDVLLRAAPYKARSEGERKQADELYKAGTSMRVYEVSPHYLTGYNSDVK